MYISVCVHFARDELSPGCLTSPKTQHCGRAAEQANNPLMKCLLKGVASHCLKPASATPLRPWYNLPGSQRHQYRLGHAPNFESANSKPTGLSLQPYTGNEEPSRPPSTSVALQPLEQFAMRSLKQIQATNIVVGFTNLWLYLYYILLLYPILSH